LSQAVTVEHIEDFSEILDVELLTIDDRGRIGDIKNAIRWNAAAYK
jgi:L-arabinose isomerase